MDKTICIDMRNMLKDFTEFDPLYDRYYIKEYCEDNGTLKSDFFKALHYAAQLEKYSSREFRNFDYNGLKQLVKAIYGDNDQSEMIEVISLVQEKFIKCFINIPHLDDLFSEHYFEYEWEMHSRLDPETKHVNFYRDHYFHQVRNLYEVFKFLKAEKDKKKSADEDDSEGSFFVLKKLIEEMKFSTSNTARYCNNVIFEAKKLYFGNREVYSNLFAALVLDKCKDKDIYSAENSEVVGKYFEEYALSYILRGALYVAALTHDIGYPISRHIQRNREFVRFVSNPAYNKNIFEFDHIRNIIDKSLLFDIVDADKIKNQLSKKKYGMDHGVISAIALLIHFYEHGAIYELDPLKRAIIELAAIINYDHTADYYAIENDKKEHRENFPRWKKNPLSIIFRIADDIQEWDRVYFHVHPYPNIRICTKCKMPMLKKEIRLNDVDKNSYIVNEFTKYKHVCACNANDKPKYELDYGIYKQQMSFNNQKINYVIACNRLYFTKLGSTIKILIDYNPYKLMELLLLNQNADFHTHRIEEIFKLKKFIEFSESGLFEINAFLHYEPEILRQKIVYDFLAALYCCNEVIKKREVQVYRFKDDTKTRDLFTFDFSKLAVEDKKDYLTAFLSKSNLKYYKNNCVLLNYCVLSRKRNVKITDEDLKKSIKELIVSVIDIKDDWNICAKDVESVLESMLKNEPKDIFANKDLKVITEQIAEEDKNIKRLINSENYMNNMVTPNDTDKFYGYFYIMGLMNDFTEMVKKFLSEHIENEDIK